MAKILIIEDSLLMRETLRQMLEIDGHNVLEAEDGPTGISLARDMEPELIVLDIMMPYMSGTQVIKYLRSDPVMRSIPIIVLSAVNQPAQVLSVLELNVRDYLLKPIDHATLRQRVEAALNGENIQTSALKRKEDNGLWAIN